MAARSELLSIDLPNDQGKTVPFYTYDGYLEETDRTLIRNQKHSFDQLKVTGSAIFAFVGYIVLLSPCRPVVVSLSQSSASKAALSPSLDCSLE